MTRDPALLRRRELLTLALYSPLLAALPGACAGQYWSEYWDFEPSFSGKVIIVGAGAAGLAAGYMLARFGVDFEIIEASSRLGGRVRGTDSFADFPIDLGAEWIHEDPTVLAALLADEAAQDAVEVVPYTPETLYSWRGGRLRRHNWAGNYYSEYKFRSSSWYRFLVDFIAPASEGKVHLDSPVAEIDYADAPVRVTDIHGVTREADRVIVTSSINVLKSELIRFTPALPGPTRDAITSIVMPDGIKAFLEFSERFYPDLLVNGSLTSPGSFDKLYYDAAYRKDSERNILALFCVSGPAPMYTGLPSDDAVAETLLAELDEMFGGAASRAYKKHVVQNWSKEPYVLGAYSYEFPQGQEATVELLQRPLGGTLRFAGEALSLDNGSTVPGAMQSGYAAAKAILQGE